MTFAPDTVEALESSVHLANSALAPDTLTTIEALQEFYVRFAYTGAAPTASRSARSAPGCARCSSPTATMRSPS